MPEDSIIIESLKEAQQVLHDFLNDPSCLQAVKEAAEEMSKSILANGKIISCGNGGSMCDAMHFAEELTGRFRDDRRSLPAISISDPSHITCVANDYGFDQIFSRYVSGVGKSGDVLLAISTSGNSPNILAAVRVAKEIGMKVVGLTGKGGGELKALADIIIDVPHSGYADRIQEIHIKVIHILIQLIEKKT